MARDGAQDRSVFEEILSDAFGTDMTGWSRGVAFDRESDVAGEASRLVIAIDADGIPLPAAGNRPEGYTLGGVMIVSISHIEYGGVRPQVQIDVWDPFTRHLLATGHSTPSMWEMDELTGDDPNWVEDPEVVERVLAEFEQTLPDALDDALGQLTQDGHLPTAPVDLWADSLGGDGDPVSDPWEDSRGYGDGPPIDELPPGEGTDLPAGVTEAVPWVADGVHEVEPWSDSDATGTDGSQASGSPSATPPTPATSDSEAASAPPSGDSATGGTPDPDASGDDEDVDWDDFESYPGEKEFFENLGNAGPPEESHPIEDIENLDDGDLPPDLPPPGRDTTVRWAGTTAGRASINSTVRVMFTDEHPPVDPSSGQPLAVISGQMTTSSGSTMSVPLFLMHFTPGGSALYGSHVLSMAGEGVNHMPAEPGDSVTVTVGGRTDTITEVHGHPLEMVHAIQKDRLFTLGMLIADMRRRYFAETEGLEDDPIVAFNRQRLDESLQTIQLGIEHADDPGVLKEQVARTQYYLDHTTMNSVSLRRLVEGKTMVDPYHDDIRRVSTLKHGLSMLSFYQNDVVIHEHFTTLVADAQAYGEFMRSEAVGKHFDKIAVSILLASYDPLIDKTPMAWLYPILSYAVTGTFTDHHGEEMSPGAVAALGVDVILKSVDFTKNQLAKTGRYTPGRTEMGYGEAALIDEITDAVSDKGMGGAASLSARGIGAAIDHEYQLADAAARGMDSTPAPTPTAAPEGAPPKKLSSAIKVGVGAVAAAVIIGGGVYVATDSGGDTTAARATTSSPLTAAPQEDQPPVAASDDETPDLQPGDQGTDEPAPQLDADEVPDDELFEIPVPERDPGSFDAETYDGPTAEEILLLPPPDGTTSDDDQRRGGGSLYVNTTYVVDWQADFVVNNGRVTPGGLFPPGSGWRGEYLILADCTGDTCVYSTPLANGDTMVFTQQGQTIYGTANDTSGGCNRDIFIAFRVSDYQTINGRLVPDALRGARIETGECETPVYREIVYDGGFEFIGSYNDL